MTIEYVFLHGFASSPNSQKGRFLTDHFSKRGITLHCPDLRQPSFSKQTISNSLKALDTLFLEHSNTNDESPSTLKWRIIGSSLGAYVAARWAELHIDQVDRLILLAPSFHITQLIPRMVGEIDFEHWQRNDSIRVPIRDGTSQPLHWEFVEDGTRHPAVPPFRCPGRIIHGRYDDSIDIALIRKSVTQLASAKLIEVEDDHSLIKSLDEIIQIVDDFFEIDADNENEARSDPGSSKTDHPVLDPPLCTLHWDFFGPTAMRTAEHFVRHLDDFFLHHRLSNSQTGVSSTQTSHAEAWCRVSKNQDLSIVETLRPHRKTGSYL